MTITNMVSCVYVCLHSLKQRPQIEKSGSHQHKQTFYVSSLDNQ